MLEALTLAVLARWRADPISFVEAVLHDPETRRPFVLLPAERAFLAHAFRLGDDGRLLYPEQVYSCPKKSGKTTFAALHVLTLTLLFGGAYPEATLCANDMEQARGRVFEMARRIVEASPHLKPEARVTESRISFPAFDATIAAIASDAGSAAGGNQSIAVFDELWAYTSERARRLWDEMVPPPTRRIACRLTVTYAGFSGESLLLEELHRRGKALPEVGSSLHAGDGLLMFWSHAPVAPWQDEKWLADMRRSLRPSAYARMIANEFVSSESAFVDLSAWDACVVLGLVPVQEDPQTHVWVGVDASTKRDSTALVACTYSKQAKCVRLVAHRVFTPTPSDPLDFEATVEATLLEWREKFRLRKVYFDPYQMVSVAQRLQRAGVRVQEYPQTVANLTAATSNLFDLIQSRQLVLYPDPAMRLAASRAIIVESSRGWRLDKFKQQKIDVVVALSLAALAAVRGQSESAYETPFGPLADLSADAEAIAEAEVSAAEEFVEQRMATHVFRYGGYRGW
jgi:phage terminase large subunit-like protein